MTLSFEINHERQAGLTGTPAENVMGCNEYILTWQLIRPKIVKERNNIGHHGYTFVEQNDNISLEGYILQSYIASEDDLADFLNNIVDGHLGQMGFDRLTSPSSLLSPPPSRSAPSLSRSPARS